MHTIKLNSQDRTIRVVSRTNSITLRQTGLRGPTGATGPTGPTGPQGPAGTDKNYTASWINQSSVTITHNLGKYPAVTVMDSAGDEVVGEVEYLDTNTVRVTFASSFTGSASLN